MSTEGHQELAEPAKTRRPRIPRSFPASSFLEALPLAEAMLRIGAGQRVRRLTLFAQLDRAPDSGASRQLITNSGQYGLTKGSYSAEYLELTSDGEVAAGEESLGLRRTAARLDLAIARIPPFDQLYEKFKGNRVPVPGVLRDAALEIGIADEHASECVETFLANARELGLTRTSAGAERFMTFEMLLETGDAPPAAALSGILTDPSEGADATERNGAPVPLPRTSRLAEFVHHSGAENLDGICFVVSPIGAADSEQRKHADLVLGALLEPALQELGLRVVRADRISQPGLITAQVIDHLVRAPLVVADLSFGNPNVFYELALRHAIRKPAVQIIRASDHLPFDVGQFRTVVLDMSDIYTLVPAMDSHRSEIARQCRAALESEGPADSPLSLFYPGFWTQMNTEA